MKNVWQKKIGMILIAAVLLFFALTMALRANIKAELNIVEGYPDESKAAVLSIVDRDQRQLVFNSDSVQGQMRNRLLGFYGEVAPVMGVPELSDTINDNIVSEDAQSRAVNAEQYVNFALTLDQAFEKGVRRSLPFELTTIVTFVLFSFFVMMRKPKKVLKK